MKVLSIITINLNNGEGLKKTIESVKKYARDKSNYEFIVIDGGSLDDSVKIIESNREGLDYWHSQKDTGIYNAMNQGIIKSKGTYLLFLNSGDCLIDFIDFNKLKRVEDEIIAYATNLNNGYIKTVYKPIEEYLRILSFPHQSTFIKRSLFNKFGLYDEKFKITGDYDWFCRVFLGEGAKVGIDSKVLVATQPDGVGSVPNNTWFLEREFIRFNYFLDYFYYIILIKNWSIALKFNIEHRLIKK